MTFRTDSVRFPVFSERAYISKHIPELVRNIVYCEAANISHHSLPISPYRVTLIVTLDTA